LAEAAAPSDSLVFGRRVQIYLLTYFTYDRCSRERCSRTKNIYGNAVPTRSRRLHPPRAMVPPLASGGALPLTNPTLPTWVITPNTLLDSRYDRDRTEEPAPGILPSRSLKVIDRNRHESNGRSPNIPYRSINNDQISLCNPCGRACL